MKNLKKLFALLILIVQLILTGSDARSQNPSYTLTAKNITRVAPDSLYFEVYLLSTNPSVPFDYAAGQYFFRFNQAFGNGGTLRYRRIGSELPAGLYPTNPTVTGNELRLASNLPPEQKGAYSVPTSGQGVMIVRMSLKTSASSFSSTEGFGLRWRNEDDPPFFTKLSAFVGTKLVEVTNSAGHFVDSGASAIDPISNILPDKFDLSQNYPNPFNPVTKIRFDIPASGTASKLVVFNSLGKEVMTLVDEKLSAGVYEVSFDGGGLSSGVYFYRIQAGDFVSSKRMVLIK